MRFFHDWEFLEDGRTIEPISVGIVAEDGREYYAVNANVNWSRVMMHEWLPENVVPHLPTFSSIDIYTGFPGQLELRRTHPDVKPLTQIKRELWAFIAPDPKDWHSTELWAWCGAYDHVLLAQVLAGPMSALHDTGMPFFSHDLLSIKEILLGPDFKFPDSITNDAKHNALADARELKARWEYVNNATEWVLS